MAYLLAKCNALLVHREKCGVYCTCCKCAVDGRPPCCWVLLRGATKCTRVDMWKSRLAAAVVDLQCKI